MAEEDKKFLLEKAIRLAAKAHKGQTDRYGNPYILHVMRVMMKGTDNDEQILGALHDVLERSELETEDIKERGFPNRVVSALDHISRRVEESYEEYIERVAQNGLAARVKIHDLADKMDLLHVQQISDSDLKRFNRQLAAYHKLNKLVRKARARMDIGQ
jgi:(p)ppGpp synthase/HD superfamily hydrolase